MAKPKRIKDVKKPVKNPAKNLVLSDIDYALCIPGCKICGGLGYVRSGDHPVGHPEFGKMNPCQNRPPAPIDWALFGLSEKFKTLGWSDVLDINDAEKNVKILKRVLEARFGWTYIYGGNGLGKTFLSSILTAEALRKGMSAEIMLIADLLDWLRDAFGIQNGVSVSKRLDKLIALDVLVLDEFGAHKSTEWTDEKIQTILQKRYRNATEEGRGITIFTSEQSPENSLDPYIRDRLRDSRLGKNTTIELVGKSVRPVTDKI